MRRKILFPTAALSLLSSAPLLAQGKEANEEFARAAQEAAPARIADAAGIARLEPSGKVTPIRQSRNGFTCTLMPDGSNAPVCAD